MIFDALMRGDDELVVPETARLDPTDNLAGLRNSVDQYAHDLILKRPGRLKNGG
ncbi:MAG: hypothetical protein ACRD4B_08920 [Acidobacteriota bacterium]